MKRKFSGIGGIDGSIERMARVEEEWRGMEWSKATISKNIDGV